MGSRPGDDLHLGWVVIRSSDRARTSLASLPGGRFRVAAVLSWNECPALRHTCLSLVDDWSVNTVLRTGLAASNPFGSRTPEVSEASNVASSETSSHVQPVSQPLIALAVLWGLLQIALPFRHLLYEGNTGWTERGHYFSWRMMLRGKTTGLRYFLVDDQTQRVSTIDLRQFLNSEQEVKFARDPALIADFGRFLGAFHHERTGQQVRVHVVALSSLNGRKPQLLIDPAVNLTTVSRFAFRTPWIVPLTEPLRSEPWTVPVELWLQEADLPENLFAENHTHNFH